MLICTYKFIMHNFVEITSHFMSGFPEIICSKV